MKRNIAMTIAAGALSFLAACPALAKDSLELPHIGTMNLPAYVVFEKGDQASLAFPKGSRAFFAKTGATGGTYYTMTYARGPHFSYGWAVSQTLGIPWFSNVGLRQYTTRSAEEQLDAAAAYINQALIRQRAVYTGPSPLVKINDKKSPRWEGSFLMVRRERDILYKESYLMALQTDGYFVYCGIINSDGEQKELTADISDMFARRKLPK
ncbi:MAG: hypothetical protein SPI25_03335 [Dialister sp.]|nr:hypothetical protein [Dialister sp.]